jgi:transposase-like protein
MYIVARANPTARAFVAHGYKAKLNPTWIILDQSDSYVYACQRRDAINRTQ